MDTLQTTVKSRTSLFAATSNCMALPAVCCLLLIAGCKDEPIASKSALDGKPWTWKKGEATVYRNYAFYSLPPFSGRVTECEVVGYPEKPHDNSGPILRISIRADDGRFFIIEEFRAGKHAAEEISKLTEKQECRFPDDIWRLRDSIMYD